MLRSAECPMGALSTQFKVGLGPFCRYSYEQELSEDERSSDDQIDSPGEIARQAIAATRPLGASSGGCRGLSRNSSVTCAPWVPAFLSATYFQPCERHRHHKKNECTFFCITCGSKPQSVCQHCMGAHAGHQVIQVRRYVYCDVVRTCDINAFVDTTGVQNYIINSAKVMFLNHRPHSKIGRANGVDVCRTCQRHLREGYSYCSLACKVEALTKGESTPAAAGPSSTGPPPASPPAPLNSPAVPGAGTTVPPAFKARLSSLMIAAGAVARPPASSSLRLPRSMDSGSGSLPAGRSAASAAPTPRSSSMPRAVVVSAVMPSSPEITPGVSSDPESSEPGEEALCGAAARQQSAFGGRVRERDASGSASSEDDCWGFNFENPPKRRRSSLISRRLSNGSTGPDCPPFGPAAAAAAGTLHHSDAAAAAAAAATLLIPFRSSSSGLSLGFSRSISQSLSLGMPGTGSGLLPEPPAAADPSAAGPACGLRSAGSLQLSTMSRRKQNAPQRAPSC